MKIFITQKQFHDKHHQLVDGLESNYLNYFVKEGYFSPDSIFIPVINNLVQAKELVESMKPDMIILTGGNNVLPEDKNLVESVGDFCPLRDEVESFLIDYSDRHKIFKLAICRGFQFLNVHYHGRLTYHLKNHPPNPHLCVYDGREYQVNSYHSHGVMPDGLSKKLKIIAYSKHDNVVEAAVNDDASISPTLGVQWHPEREAFPVDLFKILWKRFYTK